MLRLSADLKAAKYAGIETQRLGKYHLIFEGFHPHAQLLSGGFRSRRPCELHWPMGRILAKERQGHRASAWPYDAIEYRGFSGRCRHPGERRVPSGMASPMTSTDADL
jgi:hypothetical protein